MTHHEQILAQDAARIREVDQSAFRLGLFLGGLAGFGFGGLFGIVVLVLR